MKVIVAGSRHLDNYDTVELAIKSSGFEVTELVSGGCQGVDEVGERWADDNHIPVRRFIPDWDRYGLKAGPIRNGEMAQYGEALVAVWDGKSKGTKDMIRCAEHMGLKIYVHMVY